MANCVYLRESLITKFDFMLTFTTLLYFHEIFFYEAGRSMVVIVLLSNFCTGFIVCRFSNVKNIYKGYKIVCSSEISSHQVLSRRLSSRQLV